MKINFSKHLVLGLALALTGLTGCQKDLDLSEGYTGETQENTTGSLFDA